MFSPPHFELLVTPLTFKVAPGPWFVKDFVISEPYNYVSCIINPVLHSFLFIRTSNFGAEAECSQIFEDFSSLNVL